MAIITFNGATHRIASHYLPALINGDHSGLASSDEAQLTAWWDVATDDWRDADDNLWVYAHCDVVDDSHDEFARCEVTGLYADTHEIVLHFRLA